MDALWQTRLGRISTQILNEFYVTATRKLNPSLPIEVARGDVRDLDLWRPTPVTVDLLADAWDVEDRYDFSLWDSLVVAAAKSAGCAFLLTEDLQDGQDLDGVRVVNPFAHDPESVLGEA